MGDHFTAAALRRMITIFSRTHLVEAGVVGVETTLKAGGQAEVRVENHGADKRGGVIAVAAQDVRSIGQLRRQRDLEIVDQMKLGIGSGENTGVRRPGDRDL